MLRPPQHWEGKSKKAKLLAGRDNGSQSDEANTDSGNGSGDELADSDAYDDSSEDNQGSKSAPGESQAADQSMTSTIDLPELTTESYDEDPEVIFGELRLRWIFKYPGDLPVLLKQPSDLYTRPNSVPQLNVRIFIHVCYFKSDLHMMIRHPKKKHEGLSPLQDCIICLQQEKFTMQLTFGTLPVWDFEGLIENNRAGWEGVDSAADPCFQRVRQPPPRAEWGCRANCSRQHRLCKPWTAET